MKPHNPKFGIGICYACSQGRACIAQFLSEGKPFIVCEECFTEWPDPDSFFKMRNASFEKFGRFEYIGKDKANSHPWKDSILNTADLDE